MRDLRRRFPEELRNWQKSRLWTDRRSPEMAGILEESTAQSLEMAEMLESYENKEARESYREAAARGCRQYLERHIQPKLAVQCAAALGKRGFLWDVLLDAVLATARKEERRD